MNESEKLEKIIKEYNNKFPLNIVDICNKMGIIVQETVEFPDNVSGVIFKENGNYYILVNKNHSIGRKSFTIAHELGHYILHKDLLDKENELVSYIKSKENGKDYPILARGLEYNKRETEANNFAAKILMPKNEFLKKCEEFQTIEEVAEYFGVSVVAASIRANVLGGWFYL